MNDQTYRPTRGLRRVIYRATRGRINLGRSRAAKEFSAILGDTYVLSRDELRRDSFGICVLAACGGSGSSTVSAGLGACLNRLPEFDTAVVNYSANIWTALSPFLTAASAAPLERIYGPSFHNIVAHDDVTSAMVRTRDFASITAYGLHVYNQHSSSSGVPRLPEGDVRRAEAIIRPAFRSVISDCGAEIIADPVVASAARSARIVVLVCPATLQAARLVARKVADLANLGITRERVVVVINDRYGTFRPRWRALAGGRRVKEDLQRDLENYAEIREDQIVYLPYEPKLTQYWRHTTGSETHHPYNLDSFPVEAPFFLARRTRRALLELTAACLDQMLNKSEIPARTIEAAM